MREKRPEFHDLLSRIRESVPADSRLVQRALSPANSFRSEQRQYEIAAREDEEEKKLSNQEYRGYLKAKEEWSPKIFWMAVGWLVFVAVVLVLHAYQCRGFTLPTPVLSILAGTSTTNFVGLVIVLAKHFYPEGGLKLRDPKRARKDGTTAASPTYRTSD